MKGLLRKDLYLIWNYGRVLLGMCLIFLLVSPLGDGDNFFFVIYPVLLAGVLPITLLSYEERAGWNRCCDAMPLSRRAVVSSRFLTTLLCFGVLYVLTLAVHAAFFLPRGQGRQVLELAAVLPLIGLLTPTVLLPLALRFGVEKARIANYILIAAVIALGLVVFHSFSDLGAEIGGAALAVVPAAAVLLFAASWLLSIKLYEKREL